MMNLRTCIWFCLILSWTWDAALTGEETDVEFFEKRVRPVLIARCYECHSEDAEEGELRVDSRQALLDGGTRGPAVVPGDAAKSLLVLAINHADLLQMPPKQKLPLREITDLTEWIRRGAKWPETSDSPAKSAESRPTAGKPLSPEEFSFWAFQRPQPPALPAVSQPGWVQSPVDAFLLAGLDSARLAPAPAADRRDLLRRLTFNLTGLPPSPDELQAFVQDESPDAVERIIDRLLASPHYGIRWGRRWLDVARYADSNGLDENLAYANAFRYRDYVIGSFNQDKPYDRFLQEQIAGDLATDPQDTDRWNQAITATGFLSVGAKMLAEDDPVKMQMDIIDEQIDTLGQAVLGMTLGCARCHDHKYDPFRMEDYYALAGIFKSTKTMDNFSVVARWQERSLGSVEELRRHTEAKEEIARRRQQEKQLLDKAALELTQGARRRVDEYVQAVADDYLREEYLKQAASVGESSDRVQSTGAMLWEAEGFVRGNVNRNTDSYGKGIGVLVNAGPAPNFVEYDLEIPEAAAYQLETRYAAESARPCTLQIAGRALPFQVASKTTGGWGPDSQKWHVEGVLALPAGRVTLRLEHPQFFPHIDKLLLVRLKNVPGISAGVLAGEARLAKAPNSDLVPDFVGQWKQFVKKASQDPDSPFWLWERFQAGERTWKSDRPLVSEFMRNVGEVPATLPDLAREYGRVAREALEAWDALRQTENGRNATELANPLLESFRKSIDAAEGPFARPKNIDTLIRKEALAEIQTVRDDVQRLEKSLPALPEAMAVSEGNVENTRIHFRGSHVTLGAEVPRGFPRIVRSQVAAPAAGHSGRIELSKWLTEGNPLTARVMANRIWLGHFGVGIVRSADNFGKLGDRPSHPELLDWLALRLESDWSVKGLHRVIALSSAAQMSTTYQAAAAEKDPDNRWYWRANRRRLDAEEVRDAILQIGEGLDTTLGGSLLTTPNRQYVTSTANVNPVVYDTRKRSVYLPIIRSAVYEMLQAFDFPDPSSLHGNRESTTVASQTLFMLNSPFVATQSRALAKRLLAGEDSPDRRIEQAFWLTLGRAPTNAEHQRFFQLVQHLDSAFAADTTMPTAGSLGSSGAGSPQAGSPNAGNSEPRANSDERQLRCWQIACRTLVASNEFLYLD